jgi:hypothetical protein
MTVKELAENFQKLSAPEKIEFFKEAMPAMCEVFREDPQTMMGEMIPLCREMMESCGMDMEKMRGMMAMMMQGQECDPKG